MVEVKITVATKPFVYAMAELQQQINNNPNMPFGLYCRLIRMVDNPEGLMMSVSSKVAAAENLNIELKPSAECLEIIKLLKGQA